VIRIAGPETRPLTALASVVFRGLLFYGLLAGCLACIACAQDVEQAPPARKAASPTPQMTPAKPADPQKFALIIAGIGGDEEYSTKFAKWSGELRELLVNRFGFAENHVLLLCEKPSAGDAHDAAADVRNAFAALKSATQKQSAVFIFLIGHGSFDGKDAKFNLAGPDLSAGDYLGLIKSLPTSRIVFVNTATASGEFIKPLSGAGRVIITATRSGQEQNATRFPEYLIAALKDQAADADQNGRLSVLEVFNYATKLTADWYQQAGLLATEHPLIDDNGDGTGHLKAEAGDGGLAATTYFDSLPQAEASADPEVNKLITERTRLESEIEQLKARKASTKPEEYEATLEKLLIQLATVNQSIKAKQKQ
jgi:hypothetical protein